MYVALDDIVTAEFTTILYPSAVLDVVPSFNTGELYPVLAVAIDHTGVPAITTVFAVTAVPVFALVPSILVVNVLPVP